MDSTDEFSLSTDCEKTYDRGPTDEMDDLDVNAAIWDTFMNTTLQAGGHLGQDYAHNLRWSKNHFWSSVKQFFKETERLIKNQRERSMV